MKRGSLLIVVLLLALLSVNLSAQGGYKAQLGLTYGMDIEEVGLQIGILKSISPEMRLGGDIVWWLVDDSGWDKLIFAEINLNFNYLFMKEDNFMVYGLGTLGYHFYQGKFTNRGGMTVEIDNSEIALGIGAGVEFDLQPVTVYIEPRLFLSGYDQLAISFGLRYPF